MITENLLLLIRCSSLIILLVLFPQACRCKSLNNCSPSACGNIRNISFPFRLRHDPKHCGDPTYELSCENNFTTVLYLNSQKYQVKAINYQNSTIRLIDASMNNTTCSFPNVSFNRYFLRGYPFVTWTFDSSGHLYDIALPITLMRCPHQLKNSSAFTQLPTHCAPSNSPATHAYIKIGRMRAAGVGDNCTMYSTVLTSWNFTDLKKVSASEIHDSLLYGFELYWEWSNCRECNGVWKCGGNNGSRVTCSHNVGGLLEALWVHINSPFHGPDGPSSAVILFLLLILVIIFAGVTLPAKIIIGFACVSGFIIIVPKQNYYFLNIYWPVAHLHVIMGFFCALRFTIVFPFIMWFFIYKFRRRHLSRFAEIEDFFQSENNLMPIRYSYSSIKKMTRGFREKLSQGGYGTVYKGKLRSGYDVAVKLLGKPGGNGQDFMNEIVTIGRVHHVNIVNLVGYCAERSKRALVFDFMPNGSLDKYIFGREKMNHLSLERMYEIAVGVARGIRYLHTGCDIQILHFDIKPHNILLDHNFTPKITDFGLAKFYSTDKSTVTMTAARGTIGYVAPELINRGFGEVSYKADVYSFGMLLMEMIGLNKDCKENSQASSQYFPCWIYDCFEQEQDIEIGVTCEDNDDDNNDTNKNIFKKMAIVALWCIQMNPSDRPSMNKVIEMLEGQVERLQIPNRPSQSTQVSVSIEDQSWSTYSTYSSSLLGHDAASSSKITVEN